MEEFMSCHASHQMDQITEHFIWHLVYTSTYDLGIKR